MEELEIDEYGREQVKAWYCLVVYHGQEKNVRDNLIKLSKNELFQNQIFRALCVTEKKVTVSKNGVITENETIIDGYQTYVFVEMILNNQTYHAVQIDKVRTILGKEGPEIVPDDTMRGVFRMMGIPYDTNPSFEAGDVVRVVNTASEFYNQKVVIVRIDSSSKKVVLSIPLLGKDVEFTVSYQDIALCPQGDQ